MPKVECVVRGNGKGYALVKIADRCINPTDLMLNVVLDDGASLLGEIASAISEDGESGLILIFPLIEKPITLRVMDIHNEILLFEKRFTPFVLKWESRLNYRLQGDIAKLIRDGERSCYLTHRALEINAIIEDGDADVVRFTLTIPGNMAASPNLRIYDSSFQVCDISPISMGASSQVPRRGIATPLNEFSYSLRIPGGAQGHIILSEDVEKWRSSFLSIDQVMKDDYVSREKIVVWNAQTSPNYKEWLRLNKKSEKDLQIQRSTVFDDPVLVSIVTPVFNTPSELLRQTIQSVLDQSYPNWELILINASPENKAVCSILDAFCQRDERIKAISLKKNEGIALNTLRGIDVATGQFVAFLDHDDLLAPDALYEYVYALNEDPTIDLLYCDEDKISEEGHRFDPYFKPDFSLFLLREINYICHFLMVRRSLLEQIEYGNPVYDGAQDHDLILRCIEKTKNVHHVPRILYTWRVSKGSTASGAGAKPYADTAGRLAIEDHLQRCKVKGVVVGSEDSCRYHVRYSIIGEPLVSILIPNKDNADILEACVHSILQKTTYDNYEIIIIENNSTLKETFALYKKLQHDDARVKVVTWYGEFNYSKINNFGVERSKGEFLLFLNNDTEVITEDWLTTMLGICQQPQVGAVGAKLLYPDMLIQHAGVYMQGDGAGHLALNLPRHDRGYFCTVRTTRELSAVTAACIIVDREVFEEIGGFDAEYAVAFNDVDLCMKINAAGKKVVYSPLAELIHYESISRGYDKALEKTLRFNKEASLLRHRWSDQIVLGDPYMNINLDCNSGYFALPKIRE